MRYKAQNYVSVMGIQESAIWNAYFKILKQFYSQCPCFRTLHIHNLKRNLFGSLKGFIPRSVLWFVSTCPRKALCSHWTLSEVTESRVCDPGIKGWD